MDEELRALAAYLVSGTTLELTVDIGPAAARLVADYASHTRIVLGDGASIEVQGSFAGFLEVHP